MVRILNGSDDTPTLLLRTPGIVARSLPSDVVTAARLLHPIAPEFDAKAGTAAAILPVRSRLEPERCRKCGRCVDVCPFDALSFVGGDGDTEKAVLHLEAALCRGCGLCSAVCPTHSALQSALSEEWWSDRLDAVLAAQDHHGSVVLACQRRAGSLEKSYDEHGARIDVIRLRCVGQITAGMLLELYAQRFRRIIVAGCISERCRFTEGSRLAGEQVTGAQEILRSMGMDPSRIVADWSADRAGDPVDRAVDACSVEGGH
jgi:ferredoxin